MFLNHTKIILRKCTMTDWQNHSILLCSFKKHMQTRCYTKTNWWSIILDKILYKIFKIIRKRSKFYNAATCLKVNEIAEILRIHSYMKKNSLLTFCTENKSYFFHWTFFFLLTWRKTMIFTTNMAYQSIDSVLVWFMIYLLIQC